VCLILRDVPRYTAGVLSEEFLHIGWGSIS
jgi:hypothetical protein